MRYLVKDKAMGLRLHCDICGAEIGDAPFGSLTAFDVSDGYNTDSYDVKLDLCRECLEKKFTSEEIFDKGRKEF